MIPLPVSIFVKYLKNKKTAPLRKAKHPEKKENQIPFKYYRSAIAAIIRYHRSGNDPKVFKETKKNLLKKLATCEKPRSAAIIKDNLHAINQYQMHFGAKQYAVKTAPKLAVIFGEVTIRTKVDLCADEKGKTVLIRLDMRKTKSNPIEEESLLSITSQAAKANGLTVEPANVLCLRTEDGNEVCGHQLSPHEQNAIHVASHEISRIWPSL